MENKFCMKCGTLLPRGASFCMTCGEKQPSIAPEDMMSTPVRVAKKKRIDVKNIIVSATVFLFAIVMLVMSFFSIATYDFSDVAGLEGYEISVSPIDTIVLLFDSMKSLDDEEVLESDIAEKLSERSEDFSEEMEGETIDEYDDMSRAEKAMFSEIIFLTLRLAVSSEAADGSMGPFLATAAVLCVLYVLLAIALTIVSGFYLLSALGLLGKKKVGKLKNATLALLFLLPMILLVRVIAEAVIWSPTGGSDLTGAAVTVLVLSVTAFVMCFVINLLDRARYSLRVAIPRIISSVLCLVLLAAVFMPAVTVTIKEEFMGKTTRSEASVGLPLSLMGSFLHGEADREAMDELRKDPGYDAILENAFDFSPYERKDFEKGIANMDIFYAMFVIGSPYGFHDFSWAFAMVSFLMTLAVLTALLILWQNLLYFAGGRASKLVIVLSKSFSFLLTAASLALVVVFLVMMSYYLDVDLPRDVRFAVHIGAGGIVATVCALANLCLPAGVGKKEKEQEEQEEQAPEQPVYHEN